MREREREGERERERERKRESERLPGILDGFRGFRVYIEFIQSRYRVL